MERIQRGEQPDDQGRGREPEPNFTSLASARTRDASLELW